MMLKQLLSLMLAVVLAAPGCAAAVSRQRRQTPHPVTASGVDAMLMADYIRQIPVGSRVRITRSDGKVLRATLMKHDSDPIVVQRRTRIPEPPLEIAVGEIAALELDTGNGGPGRTIAIGAAAAAGATLAILAVLAAVFAD